jgi:hypothetical protein
MPSPPSIRAVLRRLAENPKSSVKVRLDALARLQSMKVPMALLERLMVDPNTPPRLLKAALDMFEAKVTVRKWKKKGKSPGPSVLGSK